MPDHLTDDQLAEMLARCEKATKGPWKRKITRRAIWIETQDGGREVCEVLDDDDGIPNADLITAARSDFPAAIRDLQAARTLLREWLDEEHYDAEDVSERTRDFLEG